MASLIYDADESYYLTPNTPESADPGNSNVLLKVEPDRACNSWLSCRSFIKDKEGNDVCYDVGTCERLDSNGNCSYFVSPSGTPHNQVNSGPFNIDISNLTGYSRVGYDSNNNLESDYYSIGDMEQAGQLANVPNGSFEMYDSNMYPVGWSPNGNNGNVDWERDMFRVVNNPVGAQTEGIDYPVDGSSFLKFGSQGAVLSEPIALVAGLHYTLTFYFNTKNLAFGEAVINISSLSATNLGATMERSQDWTLRRIDFLANGASNGRIQFYASGNADGNIFIDKVEIKPTLNSRNEGGVPEQTLQSCRLYPENNSLSCDYYDDNGHRKQGWPGYCLEYDREPGNPDACLMWYPVDRVNGDGVEEGGGYTDRNPLYYCVGTNSYNYPGIQWYTHEPADTNRAESENLVEENNFGVQSSGDIDITHRNPYGPSEDTWSLDQIGLGNVEAKWLDWDSIHHIRVRHSSPSVYCDGNLSPEWDVYYRFSRSLRGSPCDLEFDGNNDCVTWGVEHVGGEPDEDDMEWWEWWGTLSGFGWLFYHDDDIPDDDVETYDGGLEMLGNDSFTGIRTTNYDNWCNHPDSHILEVVIFPNVYFCTDVIQTVTPMGQSQHYSSHVYEGSDWTSGPGGCNNGIPIAPDNNCDYMSDLAPFGAVAQPGMDENNWAIMANPYMWDTREGMEANQPLFYEIPNGSMFNDSGPRMGQLWSWNHEHTNSNVPINEHLFAKYYGRWTWDSPGSLMGHYHNNSGASGHGGSPGNITIGALVTLPASGIRVNQLVKLSFTTDVLPDQLPLTMYTVRWGDDTITSVSGIEMRDRPSHPGHPEDEDPHVMYHIYSNSNDRNGAVVGTHTISVEARDNWRGTGTQFRNITVSD